MPLSLAFALAVAQTFRFPHAIFLIAYFEDCVYVYERQCITLRVAPTLSTSFKTILVCSMILAFSMRLERLFNQHIWCLCWSSQHLAYSFKSPRSKEFYKNSTPDTGTTALPIAEPTSVQSFIHSICSHHFQHHKPCIVGRPQEWWRTLPTSA